MSSFNMLMISLRLVLVVELLGLHVGRADVWL